VSRLFALLMFAAGLLAAGGAGAASVDAYYAGSYTYSDIGVVPGVPTPYGGVAFKNGDVNTLLVGGRANNAAGAIYQIQVVRDVNNHITGFNGTATLLSTAPRIDGGLTYGPTVTNAESPAGSVLFFTTYSDNLIGQIKSGSSTPDRTDPLTPLGVCSSTGSVGFVPTGFSGAGRIKIASYSCGTWYDGTVTAASGANTGTYDISSLTLKTTFTVSGSGPEGFVYIKAGSPLFTADSIVITDYGTNEVYSYEVDSNGDPVDATRRTMVTGLGGAEGAATDPLTGDFVFATFGSSNAISILSGFNSPNPTPSAVPTLSEWSQMLLGLMVMTVIGWHFHKQRSY